MLSEKQLLRKMDRDIHSESVERLFWAITTAYSYFSEGSASPWFVQQIAHRLPAWKIAYERQKVSLQLFESKGKDAIESLGLVLEGGSASKVGSRRLADLSPATNEAEAQAIADFLGDDQRIGELHGSASPLTEPEPVFAIGSIEYHVPPLVLMYHEGLIDRHWGEEPWPAEPALLQDAILIAFAIGELHSPTNLFSVIRRIEPHLRELDRYKSWESSTDAFGCLLHKKLLEPIGQDSYMASPHGTQIVAAYLLPAWWSVQDSSRNACYMHPDVMSITKTHDFGKTC